jgi:hypothetical protein
MCLRQLVNVLEVTAAHLKGHMFGLSHACLFSWVVEAVLSIMTQIIIYHMESVLCHVCPVSAVSCQAGEKMDRESAASRSLAPSLIQGVRALTSASQAALRLGIV